MSKVRVYELAKKLGISSNLLVENLKAMGVEVASNFSTLDETVLEKLGGKRAPAKPAAAVPPKAAAPPKPVEAPLKPAIKKAAAAPEKAPEVKAPEAKPHVLSRPGAKVIRIPSGPPAPGSEKAPAKAPPAKAPVKAAEAAPRPPAQDKPTGHEKAVEKAAAPPAPSAAPGPAAPSQRPAGPQIHRPSPLPARPPGSGPVLHHGPGVVPRPGEMLPNRPLPAGPSQPSGQPPRPHAPAAPQGQQRSGGPSPRSGPPSPRSGPPAPRQGQAPQPQGQRPGQPSHGQGQRPGSQVHRPGGPSQRPGTPHPRPSGPAPYGRPGQTPARPGAEPRPGQAPPRGPEPAKAPSRLAPPQELHRKSKRERRHDKLQAKVDRRERLEHELEEARAKAETGEAVFIREGITVKELADKLNVKVRDIIAKLMSRGILATINQPLDKQVAIELSSMFGFAAEVISFEDELVMTQDESVEGEKVARAPVVTIMGHVDHGKSSLLEAIHDVDITSKEFGGITQHIGAYKVRHKGRDYVFLDTPGHEAFTLMRARGAQVTDIVILVVAADDGVMPQTVEAINHCKAAKVPMVVAINKMDKPGADPDRVKRELSAQSVLTEDWGGDVVSVPVSAKSKMGIESLLEMVSIVADMLALKASPEQLASGTVLESRLDRARGPVATVLIQDGHLKVGDLFLCGTTYGHVRNLFDDKGVRIEEAGPSSPIEVLGFSEVPMVGALFQGMDDEAKARQVASFRKEQEKARSQRTTKVRLENVFGAIQQGEIQELPLILKADVHGSLEAIAQKLQELSTDEIKIRVVHQGVGAVSESDILLASASNALVIGFNVRPERKATELAKAEGVDVQLFTVIYDLIDRMKQALTGMLKPIEEEFVLGHAEVRQTFKVSKVGTVAGCVVVDGKILRSAQVRVLRDNVVVHTGKMNALKRFKDDASEVKDGTECGISLENYNDVKPGDVIEAFEVRFQERTL